MLLNSENSLSLSLLFSVTLYSAQKKNEDTNQPNLIVHIDAYLFA